MGLAGLCEGVPVGPSMGPFSLVYSSRAISKKMYYRLAALVNVMPFSPVWEELQTWWWSKNPSPKTNRRPGILRNGNRWANNTSCCFLFDCLFGCFFLEFLENRGRERDRERESKITIKWNRCNNIFSICAQ